VLGIQYNFKNCEKIKGFDYLFKHTVKMGCNTVFFPIQWFVVEKEEGRFDWHILDHALKRCQENKLRMSLLWFGTNQGGTFRPAPDWVKKDKKRFTRVKDSKGNELHCLCPNNENLLEAEKKAFEAMLTHLLKVNGTQHTIILMQIENEICIQMNHLKQEDQYLLDIWQERCYCKTCSRLYTKVKGNEWEFGVRSLVQYLNKLLVNQKRLFPVPVYVNYPINPLRPGEDIDIYLKECPVIDFVSPDYYGFTSEDLAFTMRYFNRGRNMLLIAEHSTESVGEVDRNLYRAICEHNAQGFDPWAIDCSFGWRAWRDNIYEKPFVSKNGKWTDIAVAFRKAQGAMKCSVRQMATAQGSENMMFYVTSGLPRKIVEKRWGIHWKIDSGKDGMWVAIYTAKNDITIFGVDTHVTISTVNQDKKLNIEYGYWDEFKWVKKKRVKPFVKKGKKCKLLNNIYIFYLKGEKAFRIKY